MCSGGTCRVEEELGSQVSPFAPDQVPSRDRQTLPQLYKLGLNRTWPPPTFMTTHILCMPCLGSNDISPLAEPAASFSKLLELLQG